MKTFHRIYIHRENAILFIVDVQNEFCKPGGKHYSEITPRIAPGVISAIRGLAEQARRAGIPIIYIQSVRTLQEPQFTVWGRPPALKIGSWAAQIVDELQPQQADIIVPKFSHDPFYRPDLEQVLSRLVPDPLRYYAVVTGGAVNICLYHTVMGLHLRNYWTVVPVDCVYYLSDAGRQRALEQFSEPAYPNVFLSRSDLIEVSTTPQPARPWPTPGT